jgi:aminoglycoside phosphotransferase (APT) family kinase protein
MLYTQGRTSLVRKTAGSRAQNDRLHRQSEKQRRLAQYGVPFPRVLSEGLDENGLAFFEMEYVPARTLAAMVCESAPFDQGEILRALERVLSLLRLTEGETLPAEAFRAKIGQVADQCAAKACCGTHAPAISAVAERLADLDWQGVPGSICHGDLTLENILVCQKRGVVFIDCDDCFVSSYWLDAAKLFQDVSGHWCLRNLYLADRAGRDLLNAVQRLERLAPALRAIVALMDPLLAIRLPQFVALHLLRTLPYTQDERLIAFVLARISKVLSSAGM